MTDMNEEKNKQDAAPETEEKPEELREEPKAPEESEKKPEKKEEKKEKKLGRRKEDERVAALEAEKEALTRERPPSTISICASAPSMTTSAAAA